jgi:tetratricopeptide (TPR) repeat protein
VAHWSLREQLEGDLNQAKHLKTQKKYDKALFVINKILKQDPEFPEALYIKAKIVWEGFENAESARTNLKKVMDLTSNKNDTIYHWSSHLYDEITSMQKRPKAQPSINEK